VSGPADLTAPARAFLVALAREAIAAHLDGRACATASEHAALGVPRGAFVTLRRRADRSLRGCIGYVAPERPLAETVAEAAVAAATQDPRFPAVTLEELALLRVEVSALSAAEPIRADEVEVGRHGLIVRHAGRSGLLLPQVPLAQGWDRVAFLEQTCVKAGLPRHAWRDPACELLAFTALVFGEGED
jgi:AmmeMemoRadiSam system protein A